MNLATLFAIAVGLAMDACAVALIAGITLRPITRRHVFRLTFHLGLFQALMPVIGWWAGTLVQRAIADIDHWVAFALLAFVGAKMIRESCRVATHEGSRTDPTRGMDLVLLSIATSIDALAVGLSLALVAEPIVLPALVIGFVTAGLSALAMLLGRRLGVRWGKRMELVGGVVLVGIGVKIVVEHTMGW